MKSILCTSAVAAAFLALGGSARANLVTNGSFEQTSVTTKSRFQNNVVGWGGGANLTFIDPPGTADNGAYLSVYPGFPSTSPNSGYFVEADGDPAFSSAITQTINGLIVGQHYTLTFLQAAGQQVGFTGPTTERWNVTFGNDSQLSSQFSLPQGGTGPWQSQTLDFTARAASQVLSFLAVGTPNGAPPISFLDGVDLEPTAVPEPGALALLGTGLIGIGLVRRRARPA